MIRRVVFYDFDGTIFRSPDRESGTLCYLRATGRPWPHDGWWGRPESLGHPVVPASPGIEHFNQKVVGSQRADAACPETSTVLLTGRPSKLRDRVAEIITSAGMSFDRCVFREEGSSSVLEFKERKIRELLSDRVSVLEIWEDRDEHLDFFKALGSCMKLERANLSVLVHDAKK